LTPLSSNLRISQTPSSVAGLHAFDQPVEVPVGTGDPHPQLLDGFAAGDLALVVPADPVGDDIEPAVIVPEQRVLVDLASAADVGTRHG